MTERPLTEQQAAFLRALEGDAKGDVRLAMDLAGYSKSTQPRDVLNSLKNEVIESAKSLLAANAHKAVHGLAGVLDEPAAIGARNVVAAASQLLDRVGLVKPEQLEVKSDGPVMFILPAKKVDDE